MITVCMATFNGARFVTEQLESILPQLGETDEVIVSDDGSTDNTTAIIQSMHDKRIRVVVNTSERHSPTANFENALRLAKGDYIFLSDQDDVWLPQKVGVMMEYLTKKGCACVVSDALVANTRGETVMPSLYSVMHVRHGRMYNLLAHNGYTGCCMAFKREVLDKALPFPHDIPMHDIWIGNVAAFFFNVRFINQPLIMFRRHEGVASCNTTKSRYSTARKLLFRWNTAKNILMLWTHSLPL